MRNGFNKAAQKSRLYNLTKQFNKYIGLPVIALTAAASLAKIIEPYVNQLCLGETVTQYIQDHDFDPALFKGLEGKNIVIRDMTQPPTLPERAYDYLYNALHKNASSLDPIDYTAPRATAHRACVIHLTPTDTIADFMRYTTFIHPSYIDTHGLSIRDFNEFVLLHEIGHCDNLLPAFARTVYSERAQRAAPPPVIVLEYNSDDFALNRMSTLPNIGRIRQFVEDFRAIAALDVPDILHNTAPFLADDIAPNQISEHAIDLNDQSVRNANTSLELAMDTIRTIFAEDIQNVHDHGKHAAKDVIGLNDELRAFNLAPRFYTVLFLLDHPALLETGDPELNAGVIQQFQLYVDAYRRLAPELARQSARLPDDKKISGDYRP